MLHLLRAGFLLLGATSVGVSGMPWDGPARTISAENHLGWTPKPTEAPAVENDLAQAPLGLGGLQERQLGFSTCGWVSKLYKYSFTCYSTNVCVTNRKNNAQGCLPYRNNQYKRLFIPTACVASTALSAICDLGCAEDPFTAHCTEKAYPECYTAYFDYGTKTLSYVGCTKRKIPNFTVFMSYTDRRTTNDPYSVSATNYITGWTGSPYLFYTPPSLSKKLSDSQTSSSKASDTAPAPVASNPQPQGENGPQSSPNNSNQNGDSGGGGTPVGAIVGGVIGGIALICICVAVTVFLCLRHRRRTAAASEKPSATANESSNGGPHSGFMQSPQQGYYQQQQQPMSPSYYGDNASTHLNPGNQSAPSDRPSSGVVPSPTTYGASTVSTSPNAQNANLVPPGQNEKAPIVEADNANEVPNATHPAYRDAVEADNTVITATRAPLPPPTKVVEADSNQVMTNPQGQPVHEVPG